MLCIASANVAVVCLLEFVILRKPFEWLSVSGINCNYNFLQILFLFQLISVLFAIGGVWLITLDSKLSGDVAAGVALAVFCAFTAALYKVIF